jgi:hypothetical protein
MGISVNILTKLKIEGVTFKENANVSIFATGGSIDIKNSSFTGGLLALSLGANARASLEKVSISRMAQNGIFISALSKLTCVQCRINGNARWAISAAGSMTEIEIDGGDFSGNGSGEFYDTSKAKFTRTPATAK